LRKKRGKNVFEYHEKKCLKILAALDVSKKRKGNTATGAYNKERSLLLRRKRERIELALALERGECVSKNEVMRALATIGQQLRDSLLNAPARIAALVAAKSKKGVLLTC
jgi:hypothetical protein